MSFRRWLPLFRLCVRACDTKCLVYVAIYNSKNRTKISVCFNSVPIYFVKMINDITFQINKIAAQLSAQIIVHSVFIGLFSAFSFEYLLILFLLFCSAVLRSAISFYCYYLQCINRREWNEYDVVCLSHDFLSTVYLLMYDIVSCCFLFFFIFFFVVVLIKKVPLHSIHRLINNFSVFVMMMMVMVVTVD